MTEARVARALRESVDAVPVAAPPPETIRARRRRRPSWTPALAAAAVLVFVVGVGVAPTVTALRGRGPAPFAGTGARATLPTEVAGLSVLTATVSDAPPGPAVALFRQGSFGMTLGLSQVLVLGADGRTYRRLDRAEDRGYTGADKEWHAAESLLSPDGTVVAVTDSARVTDSVDLVDLRTGTSRALALRPPGAVRPLAWTPDGRALLISRRDRPFEDMTGGTVAVVEIATGTERALPVADRTGGNAWWRAAVAPDGRQAVVSDGIAGGTLRLVDLTTLRVTTHGPVGASQDLVGQAAWSPDGQRIAVAARDSGSHQIAFESLDRTLRAHQPISIADQQRFVGWLDPDTVLVAGETGDGKLTAVRIDGSGQRALSRFGTSGLDRVLGLQVAGSLTADLRVQDPGRPDRGPWPLWFRLMLWIVALGVLLFFVRRTRVGRTRLGRDR